MIKKEFKQIEEKEYGRQYKNKKIIKVVVAFRDKKTIKKLDVRLLRNNFFIIKNIIFMLEMEENCEIINKKKILIPFNVFIAIFNS
ncbi:hypothetical protein MBCUR_02660 [Methanobrevibacter curvatus]|uniref:Uncharacterized protein n=1 Tax=Methanobrevibacter curvatus TaxID=49547 RepID=A0A166DBR7_9EURY|nr:hypothetical protein MBCUR_02660 [Methanobrevibacter curvatus]